MATFLNFVGNFGSVILQIISAMLGLANDVLLRLIVWMGSILQSAISLKLTYGGPAVYAVWQILRDTCNMLFIVLFVVVAFSTILNSFIKNNSFFYSNALKGIIIAAIAMNFSLAIGQSIVWAGNYATQLVLNVMPKELGSQVAASLNLTQTLKTATVAGTASVPSVTNIPMEKLTSVQQSILKGWINAASRGGSQGTLPLQHLKGCLESGKKDLNTCWKEAENYQKIALAQVLTKDGAALQSNMSLKELVSFFLEGGKFTTPIGQDGPHDAATELNLILARSLELFQRLVLMLSYAAVIIFMFARIPAIWFLLAISSAAFFTIAVPNSDGFSKWFKNLLGWCIFSPIYLLVIYFGMYLISQKESLMASLPSDQMPFMTAAGNILFFCITGFVFMGGAAWAIKFSFKGSALAGQTFGTISGYLGAGEKEMFGISTVSQKLGITPNVQALAERAKQFGGDVTAGLRGRAPAIFGTKEEALAQAQARFGVRGGEAAVAKLEADRIKRQREIIEAQADKLPKDKQEAYIRAQLNSGNRDAALAAGEILLGKGKLSLDERKKIADQYGKISAVAKKEFQERVTKQTIKDAAKTQFETYDELLNTAKSAGKSEDKRKFLEAAMRGEAGNRLKLSGQQLDDLANIMESDEDKRAFFEAVTKSGRNKVAAIESMANRGMIVNRNGVRMTTDQALADRADSLSPDDLLDAEEYYHAAGQTMSDAVAQKYREALKSREKSARMLRNASDPNQTNRLYGDLAVEAAGAQQKEQTTENLRRSSRKLAAKAKEVRDQAKHIRDAAEKRRLSKLADQIENKRDEVEKRISQLRKS